jgi:hypothetical protein
MHDEGEGTWPISASEATCITGNSATIDIESIGICDEPRDGLVVIAPFDAEDGSGCGLRKSSDGDAIHRVGGHDDSLASRQDLRYPGDDLRVRRVLKLY